MTAWYRMGTVTVTNGSTLVAGTGTNWVANGLQAGSVFTTDNVTLYEVQSVTADGALMLDRNYAGATASSASYAIIQNLSAQSATLLASVDSLVAAYTAARPVELPLYLRGAPAASQVVMRRVITVPVTLPASLTGSVGNAGTAATASSAFTIAKNGISIGTATFAASGTVATFAFTGAVTLNAGDILTVTAPSSADATLADVSITLLGSAS